MKKEYVNPSMLFIAIDAEIDTVNVSVSQSGDGIIVDIGGLFGGN